ncbi:MAG TPA: ribosome biogenesis GTP-binding protein YihA/YsxC [Thermoanaerobaculia bacterium]|nr:ribosome biogenesis GTP-binding protein YihA/YsxC [Thermoanaerobaculia bacterium]
MRVDSAELACSAHRQEDFRRDDLPQIAFIGRSNVGKSSLLNALLGRKGLARTSSTPGRTRMVNFFLVNRRCYFVDLPGYGYAKAGKQERQQWGELVDRYFRHEAQPERRERARVIQLIDAKVGATPLDRDAGEYLASFELSRLVVATKIDRIGRGQRVRALDGIREALGLPEDEMPVAVSAETGEGLKEVWRAVEEALIASPRAR